MSLQWNAESLWEQLEPLLPGLSIEVVDTCPSTNTALLERARANDPELNGLAQVRRSRESAAFGRRAADLQPCLLVAEHQSGGRGRMGRTWTSSRGASLTFSLSLPMGQADWSGLSLAVGVALAEALEPTGTGAAPQLGLKWPNDLWLLDRPLSSADHGRPLQGRKLGGILIETATVGGNRMAVIGVGLNVLPQVGTGVDADLNPGYASLHELDAGLTAPQALARIAEPLVSAIKAFEQQGFAAFADRFAARDLLRGQALTTTQADLPFGVGAGVSAHGALLVKRPDGQLQEVSSGEVSIRLQPDSPIPPERAPC